MNAYLALGSNLKNREENLQRAIELITERAGIPVAFSSVIETPPWGYKSKNMFLNQVICIETELTPVHLLHRVKQIEVDMGRKHTESKVYKDRIIDIDIIFYEDLVMVTRSLILPHPRLHLRDFVLKPLIEIAPDLVHPVFRRKMRELV